MNSVSGHELERLLDLAQRGDGEALGQLLQAYQHYLKLLAQIQLDRKFQTRTSPSDVVQETFVRAVKGFGLFRGTSERELMAWLRKILASRLANAANHHTAARRNLHWERQLDAELGRSSQMLGRARAGWLSASEGTPSQHAIQREQAVLLADALGELASHYREVIILRHLDGYGFPEIAQRMGRSVDSVKNLWARALTKLQTSLGEDS